MGRVKNDAFVEQSLDENVTTFFRGARSFDLSDCQINFDREYRAVFIVELSSVHSAYFLRESCDTVFL
jgi:hypothetical protein